MLRLTIWGSRGGVPVSGSRFVRHGGSTTCLEIERLEAGEAAQRVLIDCGTGIVDLGHSWGDRGTDTLLLQTHFHWDHIDGFPFFSPFFNRAHRFEIWAAPRNGMTFKQVIEDRLSGPNFPVGLEAMPSRMCFRDIVEDATHTVEGLQITWAEMIHPSGSTAWRLEEPGGPCVVFSGDVEMRHGEGCKPALLNLARGADVLVMDAQYFPEDYARYVGFGHSTVADAVDMALQAGVRHLVLTHHDAAHDDAKLDAKLALARRLAGDRLWVSNAYDGMCLEVVSRSANVAAASA